MYTQCPECSVAFRVTAEILRQAAGQVRCGGCGIAFNSLEHLSEHKPESRVHFEPNAPEPKMTPELPLDPDEHPGPKMISAEQSAALLKTLDQLAGEDIRIEDTGVEWRVLSEEDKEEDAPDVIDARDQTVLEELALFAKEPDKPEPGDDEASRAGVPESNELRFDDNTPLPDDFDIGAESAVSYPVQHETPAVEVIEPDRDPSQSQVDLVFGDPDEWEDLLGEVAEPDSDDLEKIQDYVDAPITPEPEVTAGMAERGSEVIADMAEAEPEVTADEAADGPDVAAEALLEPDANAPLDTDTQFLIQAEALGLDLSGLHKSTKEIDIEAEHPDLSGTSIDEDLIAAAFDVESSARMESPAAEELGEPDVEADDVEAEAEEPDAEIVETDDFDTAIAETDDLDTAAAQDDEFAAGAGDELHAEVADADEFDASISMADEFDADIGEDVEFDAEAIELELAGGDSQAADDNGDASPDDEVRLEEILALTGQDEVDELSFDAKEETAEQLVVPPQSEEEMTINMMIDQDLFAIAVEDDDGFTSTIVQKQVSGKNDIPEEAAAPVERAEEDTEGDDEAEETPKKANPLVETIIMEGETFIGEFDLEKAEEKAREKADFMAQAREALSQTIHGDQQQKNSMGAGKIAAVILLMLFLVAQFVHQSRERLATIPAFNSSIGSLYRSIGRPITPSWDVGGWRIEASKGDAAEGEEKLTIYSRVGNNSDTALPYPLLHVSLTDRFADVIGSRVLEPADYLVDESDPRVVIEPGETFNAVITVKSSAPEATGYNLDVCYRLATGQLRCAIEDFK